jgi:phage gp29-like protein
MISFLLGKVDGVVKGFKNLEIEGLVQSIESKINKTHHSKEHGLEATQGESGVSLHPDSPTFNPNGLQEDAWVHHKRMRAREQARNSNSKE